MILQRGTLLLLVCGLVLACQGCNRPTSVASTTGNAAGGSDSSDGKATRYREKKFDDIKFEMEKTDTFERTMLTPKIEETFGEDIRIRGYIYPTMKKRGLKQFVLVRDNLECCFGPGAALFDCILVHMKPGKTAEYSIRPVAVEGTFSFEEFKDFDGVTRAIYRLDGDAVEP